MSFQSSINQLIGISALIHRFGKKPEEPSVGAKQAATPQAPNPAEQKSIQKTAEIQQTKTKQKRVFKDYLMNEPTSYGKFKDLSPSLQKAIMQSYTPKERQKLMNERDAANGK